MRPSPAESRVPFQSERELLAAPSEDRAPSALTAMSHAAADEELPLPPGGTSYESDPKKDADFRDAWEKYQPRVSAALLAALEAGDTALLSTFRTVIGGWEKRQRDRRTSIVNTMAVLYDAPSDARVYEFMLRVGRAAINAEDFELAQQLEAVLTRALAAVLRFERLAVANRRRDPIGARHYARKARGSCIKLGIDRLPTVDAILAERRTGIKPPPAGTTASVPPAWKRIAVKSDAIATLNGREYRLRREDCARLLRTLIAAEGEPVLAKNLSANAAVKRPDKAWRALDEDLRALVEAPGRGARGYRLRNPPDEGGTT